MATRILKIGWSLTSFHAKAKQNVLSIPIGLLMLITHIYSCEPIRLHWLWTKYFGLVEMPSKTPRAKCRRLLCGQSQTVSKICMKTWTWVRNHTRKDVQHGYGLLTGMNHVKLASCMNDVVLASLNVVTMMNNIVGPNNVAHAW